MRSNRLLACVVEEQPGLGELVEGAEFEVVRTLAPAAPLDLEGAVVLFHEDSDPSAAAIARARSFASVDAHVLLVSVVPPGISVEHERALRQAGALDVVERGPGLERALARVAAVARRILALRSEHEQLTAGLAHDDRLSAIGLLTAGVGHEINNPTQAILSNLESLRGELEALLARPRSQQGEQFPAYASRWFETVGDSIAGCRRIIAVVRSLSVFSRTSREAPRLELTVLNEEVASVLRLIGKELRYQAKVELDLDVRAPRVLAPPHAITQVLTNLVVNAMQALEAVPPEQRKLRIHTSSDDEVVCVEVQDTGTGMAPEVLSRIYEPFFTTKPLGTGLGLPITRELVRKAGGEILVETELGRGTTFRVVLPRPAQVESQRPRPLSVPPPPLARLRLLLVDDDELLLRSLLRVLKNDFDCKGVSSGRAALELLASGERFDVLVSDIVMPEMNGYELYRAVEQVDPPLAQRAVFLSGGLQANALARAIKETGRELLDKPLTARDLARRIREMGVTPR